MMSEVLTSNLDVWTSALLTKSGAGRGSNGLQEAYGIKKLRELVLELAVRGKLVPQDPNDEPASVLLERIATTKARLIEERATKNQQPLPEIEEDNRPFTLPSGWEWERLGNLFDIQDSRRIPVNSAERASRDGPYPYYGANGQVGSIDDYLFEGERILVAEDGGFFDDPIRGVAYVVNGRFWVNNHAHVLECLCETSAQYWVAYFNRLNWEPLVRGMTRDKLNQAAMIQIVMAVPPLAEQWRIAAKVDELMALCDQLEQQQTLKSETHQTLVETLLGTLTCVASAEEHSEAWTRIASHFDTLLTTEQSIDHLKQAILQLAVMGNLVPQDRTDRRASDTLTSFGVDVGSVAVSPDQQRYPIPGSWVWIRFEGVGDQRLGKMLDSAKNHGELKAYLRNTNVQWMRFDLDDVKEMRIEGDEQSELRLRNGDLLICEGGEPGRCAIWREQLPEMYFQKALHRVRPCPAILPEYLALNLQVDYRSGALAQYWTGATIKHLTGRSLGRYPVPVPPTAEQRRIVAKVDELIAACDVLKARLNEGQSTQIHLADAIVEQAVG
jgi:type I restriction enzyme S subunit